MVCSRELTSCKAQFGHESAPHTQHAGNYGSISTIAGQVIKHECCLVMEYATFYPWHTPPALQRLFVCVPLAFRKMHECFKVRGRLQNHLLKNPNPQPQSRMAVAAYHVFKPRPELFSTQVQAIVSVTRKANENQVEVDRDRDVGLKAEA